MVKIVLNRKTLDVKFIEFLFYCIPFTIHQPKALNFPLDKIYEVCTISTLETKVLKSTCPFKCNHSNKGRVNMALQPLADRVIVKPLDAEEVTKGGIVLPDSVKEKPQEGEIVAVGSGKILDNGQKQVLTVKAGDRVLYGKYAGTEITNSDGEDVLIMREDDILAIVK